VYEGFYNLSSKPYQLSPDPRFFFDSKGHKRALAYLRYGIKQGEGFIIVTGDVGTGKSMLVSTLLGTVEKENVVATQIVTTQLQADDLLKLVAAGYGLAYQRMGKAAIIRNLESFFKSCVEEGKRVLLIVDEAQGLSKRAIEELRMLSNFQMNGRSLVQSFLLGQKEFRATMRSEGFEQLRQRVIAAYHLRPLEEAETRGYIEHRLHTAGWQGDPTFTDQAFSDIYEFTQGVPRRINTLCDRILLFGFLEELHQIGREAVGSVTSDVLEEQGGPIGEVEPMPVQESSTPAPKASKRSKTPAAANPDNGAGERMAAVEESMVSLTNVMREEMALLRKALVGKKQGSEKKKS